MIEEIIAIFEAEVSYPFLFGDLGPSLSHYLSERYHYSAAVYFAFNQFLLFVLLLFIIDFNQKKEEAKIR